MLCNRILAQSLTLTHTFAVVFDRIDFVLQIGAQHFFAARAAAMVTLIATAKLNDVDPQAWLADVLARSAGISLSLLPELLPWEW
jgi:hypothetical protein